MKKKYDVVLTENGTSRVLVEDCSEREAASSIKWSLIAVLTKDMPSEARKLETSLSYLSDEYGFTTDKAYYGNMRWSAVLCKEKEEKKTLKDYDVKLGHTAYMLEYRHNRRSDDGKPAYEMSEVKVTKVGRKYITATRQGCEFRFEPSPDNKNWLCEADEAGESAKKLFLTEEELKDYVEAVTICKELHALFGKMVCTKPPFTAKQLRKVKKILDL